MSKTKTNKRRIVVPNILVLEGLYADTCDIVNDAGGYGIEASPWNFESVTQKLKSGIVDGILLTGGSDVNPARYGQTPHYTTQSPDNMRDFTELTALRWAKENKVPVLGICRGSQIMCVSRGGTLTQDVNSFYEPLHVHGSGAHSVYCTYKAQTLPRACAGVDMRVVSLHHQCIDDPGRGMRIAARAADNVPEAIESKDGLWLGVQFHPEMEAYENEQAWSIFRWLVETAAFRRGGRAKPATFRQAVKNYRASFSHSYQAWQHDSDSPDKDWFLCSDGSWHYGASQADIEADLAAWEAYEEGREAGSEGSATKRQGKHRKAGDPAIPSMREESPSPREMVNLIERSTGQPVILMDAHGNHIAEDGSIISTCTEIESLPLEDRLQICPICHIKFDCIEDCDDHKRYVHPTGAARLAEQRQLPPPREPTDPNNNDHNYSCDLALRNAIEERFAQRFPELEPPPGDPAWEDASDADVERWLKQRVAVENGFDPEDWEDIDG